MERTIAGIYLLLMLIGAFVFGYISVKFSESVILTKWITRIKSMYETPKGEK